MTHTLSVLALVALVVMSGCAASRDSHARAVESSVHGSIEAGLLLREVSVNGVARRYAVYVPRAYRDRDPGSGPWPLIVFLNGSGECGTDGSKQAVVGLGTAVLLDPDRWPFLIVFPQKPDQPSLWAEHDKLVLATIDAVRRDYDVDTKRVYLTGLSQGGAGTWAIAARHPDLFAAIAPVCGFGDPAQLAPALTNVPIWAFHGEKDDVVKPAQTRAIIAAIEAAGGHPRATFFPNANHNAWDPAYHEPELPKWLLEHRRAAN